MSRRTPNRPARRFAARTALVLAALGVATHALVVQTVDTELERQLRFHAEFVAAHLLAPAVDAGGLDDAAVEAIVIDDPQVTRITVRSGDGSTVASGRTSTAAATDVRHRVEVPGGDGLVATVTQDDSVVQAAATALTRQLSLVLGAGLAALWLVIVPLAYRLGRDLRSQADELREQSRELQRLLDREHMTVQRLREVDEMRDRFLESISHELRTPLTVVKGSLQVLATRGDELPATLRAELVDRAHDKAERLNALLQALLDLNASAEGPRHLRWVDLETAVDSARRALPPRPVEFDLDVDGIVTDRPQLVRALGALLGNAVRHAPGDDPVIVRARRRGDDVELQVDDRGPGIPEELREKVFEPFHQANLLDAHSPGTGIGLSLVAAYAAQHGGRAWVSAREGGGARVHLLLADVVGDPTDWPEDPVAEGDHDDGSRGIVVPVVSSDDRTQPTAAAPDPAPDPATASPPGSERPQVRRVVRSKRVVRSTPGARRPGSADGDSDA